MKPYTSSIQAVAGPSTYGRFRPRLVVPVAQTPKRRICCRTLNRPVVSPGYRRTLNLVQSSPVEPRAVIGTSRTGTRPYSSSSIKPPSFSPLLALAPLAPSAPSLDSLDPSLSASPSILDPLVQFLLSSPLPAGLTILILTFIFRSAVTLPATIWQRRRMERTKRIVQPEMRRINERLAGVVARESRKKGLGYEEYKKELKRQLAKAQSALHKQHKTHPLPTLLFPLAVHIPLLITLSLTIRRTIETPGSPWASEGWWWLTHLGEVDPTMILPVVGGVVGMINAEAVGWRNKVLREAEAGEGEGQGQGEGRDLGIQSKGREDTVLQSSPGSQPSPTPNPGPIPIPASSTPLRPSSPTRSLPGHLAQGGNVARPSAKARPVTRNISTTSSLLALPAPPRPKRPPGPASPTPAPSSAQTPKSRPHTPDTNHLTPLANSTPTSSPTSSSPERPKLSAAEKSRLTSAIITNAMRFGSILFIPIAAQVPAALALYWTGSMCFTLGQNLVLNGMDVKEKRRREAEGREEKEVKP